MTTRQVKTVLRDRLAALYEKREVEEMIRVIFGHLMGWTAVKLAINDEKELPEFIPARVEAIITRLENGEPLQYVLGKAHFHGHEFKVNRHTLIPRPETAQLVDIIVERYGESADLKVLDLGTGSGCIILSLGRALKFPVLSAADISRDALDVAAENAAALRVNVDFLQADILEPRTLPDGRWDIIVSNPPYVLESEKAGLQPQVARFEPPQALFVPDDNPLKFYLPIARYAASHLTAGGSLFLEINSALPRETAQLLSSAGFGTVEVLPDFNRQSRFIVARL